MDTISHTIKVKKKDCVGLMSEFLSVQEKLYVDPTSTLGQVSFTAVIKNNKVNVHLLSVANLLPRPNKKEV